MLPKLTPLNLLEEKEKFFASDSYEPQFDYEDFVESSYLTKHGMPQEKYSKLAQKIVNEALAGKKEEDLLEDKGRVLSEPEVESKIRLFLEMHGLEDRYKIIWSSSFLSRAAITPTAIRLRLPSSLREGNLLGTIYHEIGTHAIRRVNYEQQPWFKKKRKHGFSNYLITEEGLAVLHALIPQKNKSAYSAALRYLAVDYATKHSFRETFEYLSKYMSDPERLWLATFRTKKGVYNTSTHEANTKNIVYFQGMVEVFDYLAKNDFDITKLYFGKLAMKDVDKATIMNPDFEPLLPSFFVTDREKYKNDLIEIAVANKFAKAEDYEE